MFVLNSRSSHQRCSVKKGVLRNFAKFTGKHLCQSLFFNKVAGGACFKLIIYTRPFSFNLITSSFLTFLFVRNGDIEFQKLLLVKGWFSVDFAKYCFLAVFVRLVHLFFVCLRAKKFSLVGHLLCLFLIQEAATRDVL